jgi:uncharacterized protein YcbX
VWGDEVGVVSDLWRFPVKSFAGEQTRRAFMGPFGILGDRRLAVLDETGDLLTGRRAHALLGFGARSTQADTGEGVEVITPEGWELAWDDPAVARELSDALGRAAVIVRNPVGVHDVAPAHVVSTGSLAAARDWVEGEEIDRRRFRANVILDLETREPFAEDAWVGGAIELGKGGPVLEVISPTERCVMTTFDPDTVARDNRVLAGLARTRDNLFGVYARVRRPGWVEVGASARVCATC